jgi:hypothetical protein
MTTDPESGFTEAEDAAMRSLYREMGEQDLPGEEPFDAEAGLRDLKKRLAGTSGEAGESRTGKPTREELIKVATHLHDETGCQCDPKYLMSCPNMASAILQAGRVIREKRGLNR